MCCNRPRPTAAIGGQRVIRQAGVSRLSAPASRNADQVTRAAAASVATTTFEYVGATALTVVSPFTRKTYAFSRPGARLEVDACDRSWVAFVPNLAIVTAG